MEIQRLSAESRYDAPVILVLEALQLFDVAGEIVLGTVKCILKKSRWFLLPVDISVEDALNLHDIAPRLVENQPAVEGRGHDQETHPFQGPLFEARRRPHLRELRQPVESLKSRIQKIPGRLRVVGGDEISRGDQVFIRLR